MKFEEWQFDLIEREHKGDVMYLRHRGGGKSTYFVLINKKPYMISPKTFSLDHTEIIGKGITETLSMELYEAEQDLFNYIQDNLDVPIGIIIVSVVGAIPLKMRITSFTFRKGHDALCKLEGIVF
jgi:hypothetical protein